MCPAKVQGISSSASACGGKAESQPHLGEDAAALRQRYAQAAAARDAHQPPSQLMAQRIDTAAQKSCLTLWDTGSQVTLGSRDTRFKRTNRIIRCSPNYLSRRRVIVLTLLLAQQAFTCFQGPVMTFRQVQKNWAVG